jgi:type IV secretory pathway protease TraF
MTARIATLALMTAATALAALTIGPKPVPRLVWTVSESVPMDSGVQPARRLINHCLVVAFPLSLATFSPGGYLPAACRQLNILACRSRWSVVRLP